MDCTDKQRSATLKADTIRLIENICDHNTNALHFTAHCFIEMLEVAFNSPTNITADIIASRTSYLKYSESNRFMTQSVPESICDAAFIGLTAISYLLSKNKDVIIKLEQVLLPHIDNILVSKSVLVRQRFILMLGYFLDLLFQGNQELMGRILNFLIDCVPREQGIDLAVSQQAADTLATIITDEDIKNTLNTVVNKEFAEKVCSYIKVSSYQQYFLFVSDLLKYYLDVLGTDCLKIVQVLVQRIIEFQAMLENSNVKNHDEIGQAQVKAVGAIVEFLETTVEQQSKTPIMPATIDTIEEIIKPLFELINNKEGVLFEEEILSSVKQIIFMRKFVSDTMWIVLSIIPKTKANKVLDTIMVYINYG